MKKRITKEDIELLNNFVIARDKYKRYKSKNNLAKYEKLKSLCVNRFDYIIDKRTLKYRQFSNYEDLKQDGRIALLSALKTYRPELGSFTFWATRYIKTKISRSANKHSTIKIPLKKAKDMQPFKVSKMPEGSYVSNVADEIDDDYTKTQITHIVNSLPLEQKRIVEILFYNEHSSRNSKLLICKEFKIKEDECITLINDTKENLKNQLKNVLQYD